MRLTDIDAELVQLEPPWPRFGLVTTFTAFGGAAAGGFALLGLAFLAPSAALTVHLVGALRDRRPKNAARQRELLEERQMLISDVDQ